MNIPFSKIPLAGHENEYINEVLQSGWLTTSSKAFRFEKLFAEYVGAKYACAVNSCTAALHLAIEAIGIREGDKVLVPTLTFTASAEIIRYIGAIPVFSDIDYDTRLITPAHIKAAITKHPDIKAIIIVHYGGQSAIMTTDDKKGILDICKENNVLLIEDAAHAFPTKFGNKYIGSFGDVTCFSFYANKTITTAEGGMLVTNNKAIYERAKIMRLHGIDRDIWKRFTDNSSTWEYDVIAPGYKYNLPDINAAIGLAQLEAAEIFREKRQFCAEFYYEQLSHITCIDLPICYGPKSSHSWHLFPIIVKPEAKVTRNEFIKEMDNNGIGTSVHYKPLHRLSYYKETFDLKPDNYPNAERIWKGTVSLPIYPDLKNSELAYICNTINKILGYNNPNSPIKIKKTDEVQKDRIWLSPPHLGGTEISYVHDAFDSNWIAPVGPNVDSFEKGLMDYCGVTDAAVLSSGTAAIHLALILLGVQQGDEVIASTFTFSATINPILYLKAIPILVDSEPLTWNMCPETLETAILSRISKGKIPKAIIVVHLYGMPANMTRIMEIASKYNIPIIEDAAEALGSRYKNKLVGTFGKIGILSFNGNKIITTSGGGAIISNDKILIDKARFLSKQARDAAPFYQHSHIGYNYRMSNVLAGIGLGQLEVLNKRINQRRETFNYYKNKLKNINGISFLEEPNEDFFSNYWLTTILIDSKVINKTWKDVKDVLSEENIESRPLWKPLHLQPIFSDFPSYLNGTCEKLFAEGLCLPSGSSMTDHDKSRIIDTLYSALNK